MSRSLPYMMSCILLWLALSIIGLRIDAGPAFAAQAGGVEGLISVESASSVNGTVESLTSALENRGLSVIRVVDHAANAESVGLELRPTRLIIFGNPALGTQLMNNKIRTGIDLPQKYLVWQDESGVTYVSYNSPQYLIDRHGLTGPQDVIEAITAALQNFASMVALPAPDTLPVTGASSSGGQWWLIAVLLLVTATVVVRRLLGPRVKSQIGLLILLFCLSTLAVAVESELHAQDSKGLIQVSSAYSVDETVSRLQDEIAARDLNTMMVIDHAANAAGVDKALLPTKLILFGNPRVGTQLMQSSQTIGIDLPQKLLVWQDAEGEVHVAYNDPLYLGARHAIEDQDELLGRVATILADITGAVAGD